MNEFKICDRVEAHGSDVKAICVNKFNDNLITVSRDLSTRLWNKFDNSYIMYKKFTFHTLFVNCVAFMNNYQNTSGLILSGGYDKNINCYQLDNQENAFKLIGHTANVTSIAIQNDNVVSSSMDQTAIFWDLNSKTPKSVYKGHTHGIWKVIFLESSRSSILTASADKTIIQWDFETQEIIRKFIGHTDCVRSLVEILGEEKFLSCSNDGSVRLWSLENATTLKVFLDNTFDKCPFLYDLCLINNGPNEKMKIITCGEEGLISIWDPENHSKPSQRIKVPNCTDIWCVETLLNNDFIAGCDDGMIRIYTLDKNRQNESIEVAQIEKPEDINKGLLDIYEKLPSNKIESISIPGTTNGELKKILDDNTEIIYEWCMESEIWKPKVNLTDFRGATVSPASTKPKSYVFSIDIKDDSPPIKLHYRSDQDPWMVAQKFLSDNDLNQSFLQQVVDFINQNTDKAPQNQKTTNTYDCGVSDPFTGGSRYIPSFTDNVNKPDVSNSILKKSRTFPVIKKTVLTAVNVNGLLKKIGEFGIQIPDNLRGLLEHIDTVYLSKGNDDKNCMPNDVLLWAIEEIKKISNDKLFPLLDVIRLLLVQDEECNRTFFSYKTESNESLLNDIIVRIVGPDTIAKNHRGNALTLVRLMVNSFHFTPGQSFMFENGQLLATTLMSVAMESKDNNLLTAISQWYLNQACLLNDCERASISVYSKNERDMHNELRKIIVHICINLSGYVQSLDDVLTDQNVITNVLLCLGSLVCQQDKFQVRDSILLTQYQELANIGRKSCRGTDSQLDNICRDLIELGESVNLAGLH